IFYKYIAALGGASALARVHSESVSAERVASGRTQAETVLRSDGKVALSQGEGAQSGFDGTSYWSVAGGHARDLGSDAIGQLQLEAALYPAAGLKPEGARVFAQQSVGDRLAYVVAARTPTGVMRYYFDAGNGLLLRVITSTPTYLGALPLQVDYADYRDQDGIKLPFDERWSTHDRTWERKISAIKLNPSLDAAAFQAPAGQ
ncbi:MAG: hypothetical protein ACRD1E_12430, partial [Terriglobales bacterium]